MSDTAHAAESANPGGAWWSERVEQLAGELGCLRRATRETPFEYRTTRLCEQAWTLANQFRLTAADRVRAGMDVERALAATERETRQLDRLLGLEERP